MMDIIKFTWRNKHGYWIPVEWTAQLTSSNEKAIRSSVGINHPGMTDFRILDRKPIPEDLRKTGHTHRLLSNIILYNRQANNYDANQMIEAMRAAWAFRHWRPLVIAGQE